MNNKVQLEYYETRYSSNSHFRNGTLVCKKNGTCAKKKTPVAKKMTPVAI